MRLTNCDSVFSELIIDCFRLQFQKEVVHLHKKLKRFYGFASRRDFSAEIEGDAPLFVFINHLHLFSIVYPDAIYCVMETLLPFELLNLNFW